MALSLSFRQVQALVQALSLTGGATQTIFPAAERLLRKTDYQKALEHVASRKNMERYHSMMDFLFAELFTKYRRACFRYYEDGGPLLRDTLTREQIERYDRWLVIALKVAKEKLDASYKWTGGWATYRHEAALKMAT